jgi:hypothetical protein
MRADASEQSNPIHARHADIADRDQDGRRRADQRERFLAARSGQTGEIIRLEHRTDQFQGCRIIVYDEDERLRRFDVRPSICWLHFEYLALVKTRACPPVGAGGASAI